MTICDICGNEIINTVCSCPEPEIHVRIERDKLRAEVADLRRVLGPYSTVEIALKAQERMVCQVRDYDRLVLKFDSARAAWIHHCNAPEILQALWAVRRKGDTCEHQYTSPGVGAAGYRYCVFCGERMHYTSIGSKE